MASFVDAGGHGVEAGFVPTLTSAGDAGSGNTNWISRRIIGVILTKRNTSSPISNSCERIIRVKSKHQLLFLTTTGTDKQYKNKTNEYR
ncbi:MAG: hypothetical protein D6160_06200 [Ketobacter sp.]|nr:MAG: hypothetical protein D6160_06200 [Ketobacter sp.]